MTGKMTLLVELVRRHRPAAERLLPRPGRGAVGRGGRSGAAQEVPEGRARAYSQAAQERHVRVPVGGAGHAAHQVSVPDRGRRSGPLSVGHPLHALRTRRLRLAHILPHRSLHRALPLMHQVNPSRGFFEVLPRNVHSIELPCSTLAFARFFSILRK